MPSRSRIQGLGSVLANVPPGPDLDRIPLAPWRCPPAAAQATTSGMVSSVSPYAATSRPANASRSDGSQPARQSPLLMVTTDGNDDLILARPAMSLTSVAVVAVITTASGRTSATSSSTTSHSSLEYPSEG